MSRIFSQVELLEITPHSHHTHHTQVQTPCPAQRAVAAQLSPTTRQAHRSSQITNAEASAGRTSMTLTCGVVDPLGTARCNAFATPVRPPARVRYDLREYFFILVP